MRAIRLEQPRHLEYVDIDAPGPAGPGQALVKTHRMGICGTDYSGYLGKMPFFRYPRVPGHELGVTVLETGPGVTNVEPASCTVVADGERSGAWREVDGDLEVSTTVGEHTFLIGLA